jgi:hypothetical protein
MVHFIIFKVNEIKKIQINFENMSQDIFKKNISNKIYYSQLKCDIISKKIKKKDKKIK